MKTSRWTDLTGAPMNVRALFHSVTPAGELQVLMPGGHLVTCDILEGVAVDAWSAGDAVMATCFESETRPVVLGRVLGRVQAAQVRHETISAAESLTLRCGGAAIEMRADGKVLIKGDDVTVHAKGTQRIRAGTVAIN